MPFLAEKVVAKLYTIVKRGDDGDDGDDVVLPMTSPGNINIKIFVEQF
jgi:hypothetical protein